MTTELLRSVFLKQNKDVDIFMQPQSLVKTIPVSILDWFPTIPHSNNHALIGGVKGQNRQMVCQKSNQPQLWFCC